MIHLSLETKKMLSQIHQNTDCLYQLSAKCVCVTKRFSWWIAGQITTTTRKLDREQQAEHFLEVKGGKKAQLQIISEGLMWCYLSGCVRSRPLNRDGVGMSPGRSSRRHNQWWMVLSFWLKVLVLSECNDSSRVIICTQAGGRRREEESLCLAFDKPGAGRGESPVITVSHCSSACRWSR